MDWRSGAVPQGAAEPGKTGLPRAIVKIRRTSNYGTIPATSAQVAKR